jgi:hypothetical protein
MLTIFCTPKPFVGHIGIIQRNAIRSWTLMNPDVEVILFGDEEGAEEACRDLGIRHVPDAHRTPSGVKSLPGLFGHAERIASNNILCYVNCDIILPGSFWEAVKKSASVGKPFLMIGQRWDTNVTEPIDFQKLDWEEQIVNFARTTGKAMGVWFADYFAYSRGLYHDLPPLVIGRWYWDPWIVWKARTTPGACVFDATPSVTAIHQNHDYGYHPAGFAGVEGDDDAKRNHAIAGHGRRQYPRYFSTHWVTPTGIKKHWLGISPLPQIRLFVPKISRYIFFRGLWFPFLKVTRPVRRFLGLNEALKNRLTGKLSSDKERKPVATGNDK